MAHPSARLTPKGRQLLVDRVRDGWTITKAADAAGISRQTGSKWLWRFRREGEPGLARPQQRRPPPGPRPSRLARRAVCARRRELHAGPHVLAWETGPRPLDRLRLPAPATA